MYTLTLTKEERRAIDWIGNRYNHGDDFYRLLLDCDDYSTDHHTSNAWQEAEEITFYIPEHIAWEINELFREDDYTFACFADSLSSKLLDFCMAIV